MHRKCQNCKLVNFLDAVKCSRCDTELIAATSLANGPRSWGRGILIRAMVCLCVCMIAILGFYFSLVVSAAPLQIEQKHKVRRAISVLRDRGFSTEAMLLDRFTVYRSNDNWLNASVPKENAYAATNFPFEIMTLYSDFFIYPADDVERAAILLHEARHLQGEDEPGAYAFVWKNRERLGWTKENYARSTVWVNVRRQTRETVPDLFTCPENDFSDCTEQTF